MAGIVLKIWKWFAHESAVAILQMPPSSTLNPDRWIWQHSTNGDFTVKSAYAILVKRNFHRDAVHRRDDETMEEDLGIKIAVKMEITCLEDSCRSPGD